MQHYSFTISSFHNDSYNKIRILKSFLPFLHAKQESVLIKFKTINSRLSQFIDFQSANHHQNSPKNFEQHPSRTSFCVVEVTLSMFLRA
mmetsp:Transcript_24321/g.51757  ORF Transcript_24321/g.51757 Transcript_24321/m.51757 type:complete len:89 (+) Transcript_24321:2091-2357(+)